MAHRCAAGLLWRHVLGRAHDRAVAGAGYTCGLLVPGHHLRDAEVENLQRRAAISEVQKQIGRL